jgi:Na+-transporting NADH:ubiquinone oxidoreductase subunit NqrA
MVFDISKMEVVRHTSVLSSMKNREYLRYSKAGFVEYTLTRTSEVRNFKKGFFENHSCDDIISH